ncbi:MAG: hypothetical protein HPY89_11190 [Pelotomaculum sp.]|nr:hypothetical protein [Pelotomaculum sp.]
MVVLKLKISVIIAVPDEDLVITETVGSAREIEHLVTLETREEVIPAAEQLNPDVCLLSSELPGEIDILDIAEALVMRGTRVVFMAGSLEEDNPTIDMLKRMGVTDIIHGNPTAGLLIERLLNKGRPCVVPRTAVIKPNEKLRIESIKEEPEGLAGKARELGKNLKKLAQRKTEGVHENVVAVWSPAPTGKTFVAVNLAVSMALRGIETVLLDASDFSSWALVGAPEGEDGLVRFLETGRLQGAAFQPDLVPGLYVLTADPGGEIPKIDPKKLIEKLAATGHLVVVDLSGAPYESAGTTVIVADHDYNHLVKIQKSIQEGEWLYRAVLVLNRNVESGNLPVDTVKQATGMNIAAVIPDSAVEVLESQRAGVPSVLVSSIIAEAFEELCKHLGG